MNGSWKKILAGGCLCAATAAILWCAGVNSNTGFLMRVIDETQSQVRQAVEEAASLGADSSLQDEVEKLAPSASEAAGSSAAQPETPEELAQENTAASTEEAASGSTAASEPSTAESNASHSHASSETGSSEPSSHPASSAAGSSSAAASQEDPQAQIDALVAQLYTVQDKFERQLLEIIRQAHQEYMSYPAEERGTVKKVTVVLSKVGDISTMEKQCDAEVKQITDQMTTILKANDMDTSIVKDVQKTYSDKKSALKKELVDQTYSGGDGSGTSGHWLYDRLG